MMKNNHKILISLLGIAILSPGFVLAEDRVERRPNERLVISCERLLDSQMNMLGRVSESTQMFDARRLEGIKRIAERREKINENLTQVREKWDENYEERFALISERASTEEQKTAVEEFQTTIRDALLARRTTVDEAMKAFREGVDVIVSEKETENESLKAELKAKTEEAFNQAKADCEAGVEPRIAMAKLMESFRNTKTSSLRTGDSSGIGDEIKNLSQTRNEAVKMAQEKFKATLDEAVLKLKGVLSEVE
jgi:hypothetical protein